MSFESRDLLIDVLPTGKFNALARPGLALCGQATAGGRQFIRKLRDALATVK